MTSIDIFTLREHFNRSQIVLCFNGPVSRSLIEEIGCALKNYLHADHAHPSAVMDVFGVYVEMTQNIRHYATGHHYGDLDSSATVVVARDNDKHYMVVAGNLIETADGMHLLARVNALAQLDKAALKAAYKAQLRQPRDESSVSGAGLGLIDMARKASKPLTATLTDTACGRSFFSLCAVI